MDLHLNQDSFMTHLLEITKFLKLIMKKLKNKLRNMLNRNNNMKEFCWQKKKLWKCSNTIPSNFNLLKARFQTMVWLQLTDAVIWSIFVLDLICHQLIRSRDSKLLKTHLLIGWVTRTMTTYKEFMQLHSPNNQSSMSTLKFKNNWQKEITETLVLNNICSISLNYLQDVLYSKLMVLSFTPD